mgnify:CR=1 FL=1
MRLPILSSIIAIVFVSTTALAQNKPGATKESKPGSPETNPKMEKMTKMEKGEPFEFTVFPDGRAIIKGTSDTDRARTLYAKYIGH